MARGCLCISAMCSRSDSESASVPLTGKADLHVRGDLECPAIGSKHEAVSCLINAKFGREWLRGGLTHAATRALADSVREHLRDDSKITSAFQFTEYL